MCTKREDSHSSVSLFCWLIDWLGDRLLWHTGYHWRRHCSVLDALDIRWSESLVGHYLLVYSNTLPLVFHCAVLSMGKLRALKGAIKRLIIVVVVVMREIASENSNHHERIFLINTHILLNGVEEKYYIKIWCKDVNPITMRIRPANVVRSCRRYVINTKGHFTLQRI